MSKTNKPSSNTQKGLSGGIATSPPPKPPSSGDGSRGQGGGINTSPKPPKK